MLDISPYAARFEAITAISPLAKKKMDNEGYRLGLETDEVTDDTVFQVLFLSLLDDLEEIGIEFACHPAELYEDYAFVDEFVQVCQCLLPAGLYRQLQTRPRLRDALSAIVIDGVGLDEATVVSWVSYLGLEPDHPLPGITRVCEKLVECARSDERFDAYCRNLLALDDTITQLPDLDPGDHGRLLTLVTHIDARCTLALDHLNNTLPFLGAAIRHARKRVRFYIKELMRPDAIGLNSWLFTPETTRADGIYEQTLRARRLAEFAAGSPLHVEHYQTPDSVVNDTAVVGLVVRAFATTGGASDFRTAVRRIERVLTDPTKPAPSTAQTTLIAVMTALMALVPSGDTP